MTWSSTNAALLLHMLFPVLGMLIWCPALFAQLTLIHQSCPGTGSVSLGNFPCHSHFIPPAPKPSWLPCTLNRPESWSYGTVLHVCLPAFSIGARGSQTWLWKGHMSPFTWHLSDCKNEVRKSVFLLSLILRNSQSWNYCSIFVFLFPCIFPETQ